MGIVVIVKLVIFFGLVWPLAKYWYIAGDWMLKPMDPYPKFELFFVMVIIPMILNVLQFWIQDNYLMHSMPLGGYHPQDPKLKAADGHGAAGSGVSETSGLLERVEPDEEDYLKPNRSAVVQRGNATPSGADGHDARERSDAADSASANASDSAPVGADDDLKALKQS